MEQAQYAMILAQVAMMNCEVAAMVAENQRHVKATGFPRYGEEAFQQLLRMYQPILGYNEILKTMQEGGY